MKGPQIAIRGDLFSENGTLNEIVFVDSEWDEVEGKEAESASFVGGVDLDSPEVMEVVEVKSEEEPKLCKLVKYDDEKAKDSPNCFVVQNGIVTKPFYIVKKKDLNDLTSNVKNSHLKPLEVEELTRKPVRRNILSEKSVMETKRNLTRTKEPECSESEDLMWLLDFKLDDLFSDGSINAFTQLDDGLELPGKCLDIDSRGSNDNARVEIGCQTESTAAKTLGKASSSKPCTKGKVETRPDNRMNADVRFSENKKPPFTYTELIECALQEKGPLTVSEIYHWISETFPYYKSWDDRWKNSVRHNLSINPYFRKGTKARQGSGHLWTVNKSEDNSKMNSWKRQRFQEFEEFSKRLRLSGEAEKSRDKQVVTAPIDETEMATASIENKENRALHRDVLLTTCVGTNLLTNVSLEQSAEDILSGVKKNVEVQYLEPVKATCAENDFLNPIPKEVFMGECGLLNQIELSLTTETGESLTTVLEDPLESTEHMFEELTAFQYTDMSTNHPSGCSQLLSLAN